MSVYYSPEEHGLEILGEVEEDPDYSFNKFVVWRRTSDGALFYADDAGCSCPSPFEDYPNVESLKALTKQTDKTFENDLQTWAKRYNTKGYISGVSQADLDSLTVKVREALNAGAK